jgi:predicted NAD/FAD-binding protein
VRIAIVGGGVSGLVAATLLYRDHDLVLFEANAVPGGHTHTVSVPTPTGAVDVDTGFIVYNERNYPNFTRLLARLGVATQPSAMSFSVRADALDFEYNGSTLSQLFGQRRNLLRPSFYRMAADIVRFNRHAPRAILDGLAHATVAEYATTAKYSRQFVDHYLAPMAAALWSQPRSRVLDMPLAFLVRFLDNHGMLSMTRRPEWRVIQGGAQRYVDAMTAPFRDHLRLGHAVRAVTRHANRVLVDGEVFDEVIFACHSDQALAVLADATAAERDVLGALPYQTNHVVLHTDTSLLPRRPALWAAWNYHLSPDPTAPVAVTYDMNILQTLSAPETYCVTLNRTGDIAPERIVRRFTYHHPLYTMAGVHAQARHAEISGRNRTHYCGAYWGNGFHEAGVTSALTVCRHFGSTL